MNLIRLDTIDKIKRQSIFLYSSFHFLLPITIILFLLYAVLAMIYFPLEGLPNFIILEALVLLMEASFKFFLSLYFILFVDIFYFVWVYDAYGSYLDDWIKEYKKEQKYAQRKKIMSKWEYELYLDRQHKEKSRHWTSVKKGNITGQKL